MYAAKGGKAPMPGPGPMIQGSRSECPTPKNENKLEQMP
jgi:hypothetical protein